MNTLKQYDPDRYFLSLFIPDTQKREDVATIDTLNYELAHLRDIIDTLYMGFIRIQWWRDEIKKIYAGIPHAPHDVLNKLKICLSHHPIDFSDFDSLLTAREADFEEYDSFDFFNYARRIHTPLLHIKSFILSEPADIAPLAEAFSLIGLLRSIPFYKARNQIMLPDINPAAVKHICDRAEELLKQDKTKTRYFRAHNVLAHLYLNQMAKAGYNPEKLKPLPFKELRVWWGTR